MWKEKYFEKATDGLVILYILMMLSYYSFALIHGLHWYEEDVGSFEQRFYEKERYTFEEIGRLSNQYYLFYAFNATMIAGIVWFDPRKRKKVAKLEEKIIKWLGL